MSRVSWLAIVLALSGCDRLFSGDYVPLADAAGEDCPTTYTVGVGAKRYRSVEAANDWSYADADCRDDTTTSITHLPVFETVAELDELRTLLVTPRSWTVPVGYARNIGEAPPVYRAVTGGLLSTSSPLWEPSEPDGANLPDETAVYVTGQVRLFDAPPLWNAGPFPYICQCDGIPATEVFDLY